MRPKNIKYSFETKEFKISAWQNGIVWYTKQAVGDTTSIADDLWKLNNATYEWTPECEVLEIERQTMSNKPTKVRMS